MFSFVRLLLSFSVNDTQTGTHVTSRDACGECGEPEIDAARWVSNRIARVRKKLLRYFLDRRNCHLDFHRTIIVRPLAHSVGNPNKLRVCNALFGTLLKNSE